LVAKQAVSVREEKRSGIVSAKSADTIKKKEDSRAAVAKETNLPERKMHSAEGPIVL
jgi:hypothetical protein